MSGLIIPLCAIGAPTTVTIDGIEYRPPLIDATGHLQVDVLTAALPTGAATAANQVLLIDDLVLLGALLNALASEAVDQLRVDVISNVYPAAPTTVDSGVATVTTAGTAVQLANVACRSISIRAHDVNVGLIYVGPSDVAAANGRQLSPGESVDLAIDNANRLYIDAAEDGDGVSYLTVN